MSGPALDLAKPPVAAWNAVVERQKRAAESAERRGTTAVAAISARQVDYFCAPGGIRTHTVWCLRPSSLPVGIQGPANPSRTSWPRQDELPTAYLLRLGRRYPHTGVSRLRECWG